MTVMNTKDERIAKLWVKGLTVGQIARKIGTPTDFRRVLTGLLRKDLIMKTYLEQYLEQYFSPENLSTGRGINDKKN